MKYPILGGGIFIFAIWLLLNEVHKMTFYAHSTMIALTLLFIPYIISISLFFIYKKEKAALLSLIISSFLLRFFIISLDQFPHDWDERFHALVAKNMMTQPFKPMLRLLPAMGYDYTAWCCNHIWLHKQPLFLWQMAISMKLFGVNTTAMRIPSLIMGVVSVFYTYEIAVYWTNKKNIAFLSALLYSLSFYQLNLTAGRISTDQNDVAFIFYITASIWAYCRYIRKPTLLNALFVGLFVGCAVLNKWLPAMVIYLGWLISLLADKGKHSKVKSSLDFILSVTFSGLIFVPWQLYVLKTFPLESTYELAYNSKHFFSPVEGHGGDWDFHFNYFIINYHPIFLLPLFVGIYLVISHKQFNTHLTVSFVSIISATYIFFTLAASKMPAFTFNISAVIYILISIGLVQILKNILGLNATRTQNLAYLLTYTILGNLSLRPLEISNDSSYKNLDRNNSIHNAAIYKSLPDSIAAHYIIFNCKAYEDNIQMFYKNCNAYAWYPNEVEFNKLIHRGYKIAAYKNHDSYILPSYFQNNNNVLIINQPLH